ncbi:MAG: NACHT domain-containing protein [Lyngbya sp. HA4199-MV5]|jgi:predicted NACHT family NTPase|nr:NACHT domain-containing protein [Lyngbya sp. HA4199-MV5]
MSEYLQAAVQRVLAGSRDEADLMAIATAIQTGQFTWASDKGAVGVGGDVVNSLIVPGSYNIIDSTIVLEGEAAIAIQTLLTQRLGVTPTAAIPLDALLQQVRSRASTKILNLFSQIQLLNKRQLAVDQLYVDVYVLEVRNFRATIPGLLEGQDAREQFDRFGLGKRGERSPGLAIAASEDFPRLMVLGKPGSGKSTFLRYLAVSCARGEFLSDYIPVLLELRDVDEAAFNLFQYLHGEFGLEQEAQTEQILKQGRVLLLLDGLDEVPSSLRQTVQRELRKFAKRYDKNRFILTCRTQTTEYIPEQFQAVEVADFKPEQVECFALHWFTTMAGTSEQGMALKNQFMEKLRESPQTAELAVTPVLLSLTCWIFDDMKGLPQKRSDLYRDGLDLLLQQWDEGRGISRDSGCDRCHQLTTEERKRLLSYVAVRKFEQAENFVLYEESELCGYIAEHLQVSIEESQAVLEALSQQHGLLIKRAQGIWSFSHLTFQEYLAAKWFCDRTDWQNLIEYLWTSHWHEVFLMTSEMAEFADELLCKIKQEIDFFLHQDRFQAFLSWVYEDTQAIESAYRPSVVRAFYFSDFDDDFSESLSLRLDDSLSVANDLRDSVSFSLGCDPDDCYRSSDRALAEYERRNVCFAIARSLIFDIHICQELRSINQLDLGDLDERADNDYFARLESWQDELYDAIQGYESWVHDWEFENKDQEKFRKYYNVNKLLVDCLNVSSSSSDETREQIEEALLLPIAEIEKRKK